MQTLDANQTSNCQEKIFVHSLIYKWTIPSLLIVQKASMMYKSPPLEHNQKSPLLCSYTPINMHTCKQQLSLN